MKYSRLGNCFTLDTVSYIKDIYSSLTVRYVWWEIWGIYQARRLARQSPPWNSSTTWRVIVLHPYGERQIKTKNPAKCGTHFIVGRQREHLARLPDLARSSSSQSVEWKWSDWRVSVNPCSMSGQVLFLNIYVFYSCIFTIEYCISCVGAHRWRNIGRMYKANDVLMPFFLLQ
jgi:hypothetical protein